MQYFDHIVSSERVAIDPAKVEMAERWPVPCGVQELQRFLGTVGYYQQYIPRFTTIAKPLHQLVRKEDPWQWTSKEQAVFDTPCHSLTTAPVLEYPDQGNTYILDTDASGCGVGAVLSQQYRDQERVIAYYSKTLTPSEQKYCVTRRELLALVEAVKHFCPYL